MQRKAFGQINHRNVSARQTEGAMALLTIEMGM